MAMPDASEALLALAAAPRERADAHGLQRRGVQPVGGRDPRRGASRRFPSAQITYKMDEKRQGIVDSWPADVDDSAARADWGFRPAYDFDRAFREYLIPTISTLLPLMTSVTAFAPATVSNVACGFDVLGFALDAPGDEVTARFAPSGRARSTTSPATAAACRARRRATPPASRRWRC